MGKRNEDVIYPHDAALLVKNEDGFYSVLNIPV